MKAIEPGAFSGLKTLKTLFLHRNKLYEGPDLTSVKTTIRKLDLSYNKLVGFPKNYFKGFVLLSRLFVGSNQLVAAPSVGWLAKTLGFLDLLDNRITSLKGLTNQEPFEALRYLILRKNNIDAFDVSILSKMPKLEHLDISRNRITEIDDYRPFLSHDPNIHPNPFHCNKSMAWISSIKATEWELFYRPKCATPWCLKGWDMLRMGKYVLQNSRSKIF